MFTRTPLGINNNYKVILFDLGGVLIELTGVPRMMELTDNRYSVSEMWEKWIKSPVIRAFESGRMNIEEFSEQIVKEFGIDIHPAQYLKEFIMWPKGKYPGADELLSKIKSRIKIGVLSNTNELHWKRFKEEMNITRHFDYIFASHITSHLKPDIEAYLYVINRIGVRPDEILFFDDNEINVEGAKKAGIDAVRVDGISAVEEYLGSIMII